MLVTALAALLLGATPGADLRITYWPEGARTSTPRSWTLRCDPAGGSLPRPADACRRLAATPRPFAPLPDDRVCTELYGGPDEAVVAGRYGGRRVWVRLRLRDGCEISRWQRLRFLTPGMAVGG